MREEYWHSGAAKSLHQQVQSSGITETLFHDPATGDRILRYSVEATGLPVMFLRLALGE